MKHKIQDMIRNVVVALSYLHRSNWIGDRYKYPQLWWIWPGSRKYPKTRQNIKKACGVLTGHEISKTEWGYGGGGFVDRHCRWCDKLIRVPKQEEVTPGQLKNIFGDVLKNGEGS